MNMNKELEIEVSRYLICEKDGILDALNKRIDKFHISQRTVTDYKAYDILLSEFILREITRHILTIFSIDYESVACFISLDYLSKVWNIKVEEMF